MRANRLDPVQINDLISSFQSSRTSTTAYQIYLPGPARVKSGRHCGRHAGNQRRRQVWTIRIKPGIYFADDPAFRGRKRELTAQDYVYSLSATGIRRASSRNLYLLDKQVVGMDACASKPLAGGKFDYDGEVEGLRGDRPL